MGMTDRFLEWLRRDRNYSPNTIAAYRRVLATINDPETADYISKRCGTTTVEIDQMSRSSAAKGTSRTRSKQLAARALIQPHEVLRMRGDEQIVFTAGNPPLRCGRAIWFRRADMKTCVGQNRFHGAAKP